MDTIEIPDLPPCPDESADNCIWNATTQGNGIGNSFFVQDGIVTYVAPCELTNTCYTPSTPTGTPTPECPWPTIIDFHSNPDGTTTSSVTCAPPSPELPPTGLDPFLSLTIALTATVIITVGIIAVFRTNRRTKG